MSSFKVHNVHKTVYTGTEKCFFFFLRNISEENQETDTVITNTNKGKNFILEKDGAFEIW